MDTLLNGFVTRFNWTAWLLVLMATGAQAATEPDFDALGAQIDSALQGAGSGGQTGERIELDRFAPDGWEIRISAAWDGSSWRVLALRLHHPERIEHAPANWLARYRALLVELPTVDFDELVAPELFDVPPPAYLPALPGELRTRQFEFESFWYQASWTNAGGVDEFARWELRSLELVAVPPRPGQ